MNKTKTTILPVLAIASLLAVYCPAYAADTEVYQPLTPGDYPVITWDVPAAVTPTVNSESGAYNPNGPFPAQRTFKISAYYSPLPGQNKYVTGSYSGDIKLNGGGVHGADGTNVYPGMIAAPKSYPFGTKLQIPGLGTVAVHDRGGAIVHTGERGNLYDRLDVWMGYGDAGLTRALKWGKRTVTATVYGVDSGVIENITLTGYSADEKNAPAKTIAFGNESNFSQTSLTASSNTSAVQPNIYFGGTLEYGMVNEKVGKMQEVLKRLNYYNGEINSVFDKKTLDAVTKFQINENIVAANDVYGAGYVGPKTANILAYKMNISTANAAEETFVPANAFTRDLNPGDSGDDVRKLQEELVRLNLLGITPTGNYGVTTQHAVFKFQQISSLAGDNTSTGAGIFGPKTRTALNLLIAERERIQKMREDNV